MQTETLTFQLLAVTLIDESPLNPRKHFDPTTLAELAESLRRSGMLEPVTVRPIDGDRFELASGHRRFRAAMLAGLDEIPAIIREMTQEEFVEMLTVANLQRDNVHPLEQAFAYQEMITSLRWDVATIARRVSRHPTQIYRTLKFLSLSEGARQLFGEDRITTDIAAELARLPIDAQDRAIDPASTAIWERTFADLDQEEIELDDEEDNPLRRYKLRTVNEFKEWIQKHVFFHPAEADPVLFPESVAAFQEAEAEERKVVSITYSLNVHPDAKATGERIYGPQQWRDASKKACPSTVLGVVAEGRQQSRAFNVCLNKRSCETHWKAEIEQKRRMEQTAVGATDGAAPAPREESTWEREQRIRVEKNAQAEIALPAVLKEFAAEFKKVPVSTLVDRIVESAKYGFRVPGSEKGERSEFSLVKRGRSADEQLRWLAWSTVVGHDTQYDALVAFGKELGVDVKKLIKAAQPKAEKTKPLAKAKG